MSPTAVTPLDPTSAREQLAFSLKRRVPTSVIANAILSLDVDWPATLERELVRLTREFRYTREGWWMPDDFDAPVPATRQLQTYQVLFPDIWQARDGSAAGDADRLRQLVGLGMDSIGYEDANPLDALQNREASRPTKAERKRLRFLNRLQHKADAIDAMWRYRAAQMQAKSRLAYQIDAAGIDDVTLSYVAYLAARANRRSIFQVGSQSRAKDTIVEGLRELLPQTADWFAVAHVEPTPNTLQRVDAAQLGTLIGKYDAAQSAAALELCKLWPSLPTRTRKEMVMVKGVDSSRWNAYAGALNTMRSAWINATEAGGLGAILEEYLPGKAPRLMASDLVWYYRSMGKDLHEDTRLFDKLPHPWDVVLGKAKQGRTAILEVAEREKIDALKTGWVGPRMPEAAERPEPEPTLVHGIIVANPALGKTLKRCGAFSGKKLKHLEELLVP